MARRILFVHFGDPWIRGSERVLLDLFSRAGAHGIEPLLWCNGEAMAAAARGLGVATEVSDFSVYFDYHSPRFSPRRYFATVSTGLRLARDHGAEVIHCNSAAPVQWSLPVAWRAHLPILLHLHAPYLRRSRIVTGMHLPDRIVGVSRATLADCRKDGVEESRLQVIYNGIAPERLQAVPRQDVRQLLELSTESVVVAIIGSLVMRKGHDILFAAFDRLADRFPFLHLAVVGGGPDEAALRALATSPRIHFLGESSGVGGLLQGGIDFLVLPSRKEAAPLVIAEAALFGVPSIGARIDGVPEMIQDGETGLLVPGESPEALAEAMTRLIEDEPRRRRMGKAAEALFARQFHADQMAASFAECYDVLVAAGPGGLPSVPGRLLRARSAWWR
jgi:hypothetical protein